MAHTPGSAGSLLAAWHAGQAHRSPLRTNLWSPLANRTPPTHHPAQTCIHTAFFSARMSKAELDSLKQQIQKKRQAADTGSLGDKTVPPLPKLAIKNRRVLKASRLAIKQRPTPTLLHASSLIACSA